MLPGKNVPLKMRLYIFDEVLLNMYSSNFQAVKTQLEPQKLELVQPAAIRPNIAGNQILFQPNPVQTSQNTV